MQETLPSELPQTLVLHKDHQVIRREDTQFSSRKQILAPHQSSQQQQQIKTCFDHTKKGIFPRTIEVWNQTQREHHEPDHLTRTEATVLEIKILNAFFI